MMKSLIAFLSLFALVTRAEESNTIGAADFFKRNQRITSRIVHGLKANEGLLPWQARVFAKTSSAEVHCGGALISAQWVLSSAHCVDGASSLTLYLGTVSPEPSGLKLTSTYYLTHYNYNPSTFYYDVGLISLPYAITYTGLIWPVRLPTSSETLPDNSNVIVSGYGSDDGSSTENYLSYAKIKTISNVECALVFGNEIVTETTLCAVGEDNEGPCLGDAGGPLVYYDLYNGPTIHGIVSFLHSSGCSSGYPSGYLRVQAVADWIRAITAIP